MREVLPLQLEWRPQIWVRRSPPPIRSESSLATSPPTNRKLPKACIAEVEKLGQTVHELEEALLSRADAANVVRDYRCQFNELKGEKKTLEMTLSRVKVTETRVAVVVANEWKDASGKVMPVKRWLEERHFLMQYCDKQSIAERAEKIEGPTQSTMLV